MLGLFFVITIQCHNFFDTNPSNAGFSIMWFTFGPHTVYSPLVALRFLNGGVLRNLNIYSFQKSCPVCSATWLSDALCMVQYEVCWPVGTASASRAPQQLTRSSFKYTKYSFTIVLISKGTDSTHSRQKIIAP